MIRSIAPAKRRWTYPYIIFSFSLSGWLNLATGCANIFQDAFTKQYGRAMVSREAGRYAQAVDDLEAAYAIHPDSDLLLLLADSYIQLGQLFEALDEFRRYQIAVRYLDNRANVDPMIKKVEWQVRSNLRAALMRRKLPISLLDPFDSGGSGDPCQNGCSAPDKRPEATLVLTQTPEVRQQKSDARSGSGAEPAAAAPAAPSADAKKALSAPTSQGPRGESSVSSPGVGSPKAATKSAGGTTPPIPRLADVPAVGTGTGHRSVPLARPIGPTPSPGSKDAGKPAQSSH